MGIISNYRMVLGSDNECGVVKQWMKIFIIGIALSSIYLYATVDIFLLLMFCATSYAAGSLVRFRGDSRSTYQMFLHFLIGSLFLALFIWISTLYNFRYRELYCALSALLIISRWKYLRRLGRNIQRYYRLHAHSNPWALALVCILGTVFFVYASYPIHSYDSLTKHINIPVKILASTHYDYNVIESVVFGEISLFMHMTGLYLLAIGGIKSVVYIVALMSWIAVFIFLRFFRKKEGSSSWGASLFLILYSLTPLTLQLSTIYYTDAFTLPFLVLAAAYVLDSKPRIVALNFPLLFLLIGAALYAKPTAMYMGLPIAALILLWAGLAIKRKEMGLVEVLKKLSLGLPFMFLPCIPTMLIVWYKTGNPLFPFANGYFESPYFSIRNFADPFSNKLGLDFSSIWSMVFHTNKNLEMPPLGLGLHLLLLPVAIILPLYCRNWKVIGFAFLCIAGYFMSTRATYNIRYFLPAFVLSIFLVAHAVGWTVAQFSGIRKQFVTGTLLHAALVIPCIIFILFLPVWSYAKFNLNKLKPHPEMTMAPIDKVYAHIPDKSSRVLLNIENPFRSTYPGPLCSLSWHNTFLLEQLKNNILSEKDLLASFDYVISSKNRDNRYHPGMIERNQNMVDNVFEFDEFILCKVKHILQWQEVFSEVYPDGIDVTAASPKIFPLKDLKNHVRLVLESGSSPDVASEKKAQFQINWLQNDSGTLAGVSLIPFDLKPGRNTHEHVFDAEPYSGMLAVVYLTSHDDHPIRFFSLKVWSSEKKTALDKYFDEYSNKWPPVASILKKAN